MELLDAWQYELWILTDVLSPIPSFRFSDVLWQVYGVHVPQSRQSVAMNARAGQRLTPFAGASEDTRIREGMLESAMRGHAVTTSDTDAAAVAASPAVTAAAGAISAGTSGCRLQVLRMSGCGVTNKGANFLLGECVRGALELWHLSRTFHWSFQSGGVLLHIS